MIPPKVAQIMLNLCGCKANETVLEAAKFDLKPNLSKIDFSAVDFPKNISDSHIRFEVGPKVFSSSLIVQSVQLHLFPAHAPPVSF